jgi:L-seryl-tRNA(Ser) seleniumtransferase
MDERTKESLKKLPKTDKILILLGKRGAMNVAGKDYVVGLVRTMVDEMRESILKGKTEDYAVPSLEAFVPDVEKALMNMNRYRLKRMVNATGVVLHTNLGRAPLCREALERVVEVAKSYSNLEYDENKGQRGLRYSHVRDLLRYLTGAEDALVVNNNAAAVFLTLNTLAEGREAIVSRGELVEIGGEFRIPEIMRKSGAILREVGSTNRTRIADYEGAITEQTALMMKVHTSNYRIVGFTEDVPVTDLVSLGAARGIPVLEDLGSGCMIDLSVYGLPGEPTVREVIKSGVDVITFSGDKLLGGPQAGIILGKREMMKGIMKNPLNRALRIDKLTLAALEATLMQYLSPDRVLREIRPLRSLTEDLSSVEKRARKLAGMIRRAGSKGVKVAVSRGVSAVGGGAFPLQEIPTLLVSLRFDHLTAIRLDEKLRHLDVPIISRIAGEEIFLDLRTVADEEFPDILAGVRRIVQES